MPGYPSTPAPEGRKKKSFFQAAFGEYIGIKETPEEKKSRLDTEYQLYTTEAKTLRAKNQLQKERNALKKLSNEYGQNSNTPDYLGLYSKPSKKSKDAF